MTDRRLKITRRLQDLEPGDCVRKARTRRIGFVERFTQTGFVIVLWSNGDHEEMPVVSLRRVAASGSDLDRKGGGNAG